MQPPDELMVQVFLPAMRHLVTYRLRSEGLSQNKISSLLGITQASVSMYLSSERRKAYLALEGFSISRGDADGYADQLSLAVRQNATEGVSILYSIWTELLGRGNACPLHRELYPSLSDCDVCIKEYGRLREAKSRVVSEVTQAVRLLESSPDFVNVMPEVSVNIACATEEASSPADVIAVPGRIVRVKKRVKAMLPPEAGASVHMAKVLLLIRHVRPELRACINIRFDSLMSATIRKSGLRTLSVGNYPIDVDDPTIAALKRILGTSRGRFDAIVDEGGSGIEPNVYLFARGAREVAEKAVAIAKSYSAA